MSFIFSIRCSIRSDYVVVLFCSHAVNLLSNLPAGCLDTLIHVPVQGGQELYGGNNMAAIQVLLEFLEKRIDKVNLVITES